MAHNIPPIKFTGEPWHGLSWPTFDRLPIPCPENLGPRRVYLAYVCGYASIRDWADDSIVYRLEGRATYECHLREAERVANRNGWDLC